MGASSGSRPEGVHRGLVLLPLVYGVTMLYSRRLTAVGVGKAIRVLDAISIGSNRSVCLIEVGDRVLVLGVTQQQISTLAELTDPEEVERLRQHGARSAGAAFGRFFETRLGAWHKEKDGRDGK